MIRALFLCVLLLPGLAAAQDFVPRLYDVTGVASADVLNVRAGPSASAQIVGTLAPTAKGIEVVGLDDTAKWGRIAMGEGAGWVSLAFLDRRYLGETGMAEGMRCSGTEPFWSLAFSGGSATLDRMDAGAQSFPVAARRSLPSSEAPVYGWTAGPLTGVIVANACSDGMSDRPYGWQTAIVTPAGQGGTPGLLVGCCTLDRR